MRCRLLVAALFADAVVAKVVLSLAYLLVADRAGLPVVGFIVLPIAEGVFVRSRLLVAALFADVVAAKVVRSLVYLLVAA